MIKIAKTAGFCMGVRRAVEFTLNASNKNKIGTVYTFGPLIHNPQVLALFNKKGVFVLESIPEKSIDVIIIRAHGVSPLVKTKLKATGCKLIDATCPHVARVQSIIKNNADKGFTTIIVGDKNHPEVEALVGYAGSKVDVVCKMSELKKLTFPLKTIMVAQTTQNIQFYNKIKEWIAKNNSWCKIFNTVCDSTEKRQTEAKSLADSVDIVIVVGGNQSGNTKRLKEVAEKSGKLVLQIETELELFSHITNNILRSSKQVGITAGASTPNWVIKNVYDTVESIMAGK